MSGKFGYYIIALIDVLGQQSELKKLKRLPLNDEENEEFLKQIRKSFGVIKELKDSYNSFYAGFFKSKNIWSDIRLANQPEVKFQRFSDSLVIYQSFINDNSNKILIQGIDYILGACGQLLLNSLERGFAIRGGIELGLAMEIGENEIYGPALSCAYNIESKIANYPRIVLGKELMNYINLSSNYEGEGNYEVIIRKFASLCNDLITNDYDGYPIIDYLGSGFNNHIWKDQKRDEIISKIGNFIDKSLNKFKDDEKLQSKYSCLKEYFNKSIKSK